MEEDHTRYQLPVDAPACLSPSESFTTSKSDSYVTPPEGSILLAANKKRSSTLESFRSISTDTFFTPPGSESSRSRYGIKDILMSNAAKDTRDDTKEEIQCYMFQDSSDSQHTVKSVTLVNGKVPLERQLSLPEKVIAKTSSPEPTESAKKSPVRKERRSSLETSTKGKVTPKKIKSVSLHFATDTNQDKDKVSNFPKSPSSGLTTPSDRMTSTATTPDDSVNRKFWKGGTRALLIQKVWK
ncbi:uncharacterized protein LOC121381743 [Gigantopelta aegis]|uniref:uncharacterized protein LOC121381743 n=1 Tax=Gigantopelta aegis TaxID=1735272 RepID=UPI001B88862C|nr:uncharacterized protein LOC121381743 [Gigantopelta aegis]